jgi:hypothetical protein
MVADVAATRSSIVFHRDSPGMPLHSVRSSMPPLTAVVGTVQMLNCRCKRPPATLLLKNSGGSETDGEHRDIVFLAEGLRHGSDLCGGTAAEVASTFEAEKLATSACLPWKAGQERLSHLLSSLAVAF